MPKKGTSKAAGTLSDKETTSSDNYEKMFSLIEDLVITFKI